MDICAFLNKKLIISYQLETLYSHIHSMQSKIELLLKPRVSHKIWGILKCGAQMPPLISYFCVRNEG